MFLALISMALSSSVFAKSRAQAGTVVFALGHVIAKSPDGKKRAIGRKSIVYSQDLIVTNNKSQLQIRFADNGFVSIRPNSEFRIDEFTYTKSRSADKNSFELVKGGFRAITGQIGRVNKAAFKVKTPVGTLGIRGTDFTAMFCRNDCGGGSRDSGGVEDGLYVGVVSGGVEVVNKAGSLLINPNQYGFVQGLSAIPKSIPTPPSFLMFDRTRAAAKKVLAGLGAKKGNKNKKAAGNKNTKQQQAATGGGQGDEKTVAQGGGSDAQDAIPSALSDVAGDVIEQASLNIPELADDGGSFSLLSSVIGERFGIEGNSLLPASSTKLGATAIDGGDAAVGAVTDVINSTNIAQDINTGGLLSGIGGGDSGGSSGGTSPDTTVPDLQPEVLNTHKAFAMTTSPIQSLTGSTTVNHLDAVVTDFNDNEINAFLDDTANDSYLFDNPKYSFFGEILDKGHDTETGLSWGRWASGDVAYGTEANPQSTLLGESMHWIVGLDDSIVRSLPITGTAEYLISGNTTPMDELGNRGVMEGTARLDANFTTQTVDTGFIVTMGDNAWAAGKQGISIGADATFAGALDVSIANRATPLQTTTGSGEVNGFFVGADGAVPNGAGMVYQLHGNVDGKDTTISGAAAFRKK